MKRKILLSALLSGGALLASCGGGGGGDTSLTPSDITPASYATIMGYVTTTNPQTNAISPQAYQVGQYVLRYISAVTVDNGQVIVISDEINDNGGFELKLLKDKEYVFTIFDNDGQPLVSTIGKAFRILDNDEVLLKLVESEDGTISGIEVEPVDNDGEPGFEVIEDNDLTDTDNDGIADIIENSEEIEKYIGDMDGDGVMDSAEDIDNDGTPDIIQDHDNDGIPDIFEDEDNDGIKDAFEVIHGDKEEQNEHRNGQDDHNKGKENRYSHGNDNDNHDQYMNDSNNIQDPIQYVMDLPEEDLTEAEVQGILFMREEEKLARDVYKVLMEMYGDQTNTFANITESEQRHMDMVKALIDKYELYDPVEETGDQIGIFVDNDLQALYDKLVARGQQSLEEALKVGALIEEIDIIDLKDRLEQEDNQDIRFVYENLMKGSRNHLRAFVKALKQIGVEYEPQELSQEEYEEIINSDMERGHGSDQDKGHGRGNQGGKGKGHGNNNGKNGHETANNIERIIQYVKETLPKEELTELEAQGILFMREEEKLARDVYLILKEQYENDTRTFTNISESEQRHMDMVKALIDKYGLQDPVEQTGDQIGKFVDNDLQALYDELVTRGQQSLKEALKVGALIEEVDIVDLKERLEQEDNQDIKFVYENLMRGSRNHLRAFVRALKQIGVEYQPQKLSQEEYEEIINSDMERGYNFDNDSVLIFGKVGEDAITPSSLTKRYIAAYRLDSDNDLPVVAEVKLDNSYKLVLKKGAQYTIGLFDENGNPEGFTEGEKYAFLSDNAVTLLLTDKDNDGIKEIVVDPLKEETVLEEKSAELIDSDGNRIPDALENDRDHDGEPDYMKALKDEDGNGIPDLVENKGRNDHGQDGEDNRGRGNHGNGNVQDQHQGNQNDRGNHQQENGQENHGNNQDKGNGHQQKDRDMNNTEKGNHNNGQEKGNQHQGNNENKQEQNHQNGQNNNNNHQNMNGQQENHNQGQNHQNEQNGNGKQGNENSHQGERNNQGHNENGMNTENGQNHQNDQGENHQSQGNKGNNGNQGQQENHQGTGDNQHQNQGNGQEHQGQQGNGNHGQGNQQNGQENHSENDRNHGQGKQNGRGNQDRQNTGF